MPLLLHRVRHGYNINARIFLPALKLYDSSYTIPEKFQIKFSSQRCLNLGKIKFIWQSFFCYFMQVEAFFLFLSSVLLECFLEFLTQTPKTVTNEHLKNELQNSVKSSFHNIYTLILCICQPSECLVRKVL